MANVRKDLPKLRAQILFYPFLQGVDFNLPSYQQNHAMPLLFQKFAVNQGCRYITRGKVNVEEIIKGAHVPEDLWVRYKKWLSADNIPEEFKVRGYEPVAPAPFSKELYEIVKDGFQPTFSPLLAEDEIVCQLPETFLITCEYDILRDDGLLYKKRLEDSGVPVTWHHIEDGIHGMTFTIDYGVLEFPNARITLQHLVHFLGRL
ncbi:arylacetamide deacetylase-like 3 [Sceloporus undulatus]|uniref:arylacetamide deacetylase-like 3 n=1 Tax=Sceloporus undulatus TaxID=8520 RepID=UPI001C4B46D8|nr:arylacetamide deacetylase-like 3 [Sceloporus undulatus]